MKGIADELGKNDWIRAMPHRPCEIHSALLPAAKLAISSSIEREKLDRCTKQTIVNKDAMQIYKTRSGDCSLPEGD